MELAQRDTIFALFEGIIKRRDDILDSNDLNNLLAKKEYHNVERKHYKLWISSTNVLTTLIEEVTHRGIIIDSKFELKAIKKTVPIFVQNPGFERALNILEENRYVLISGKPGVGKTTLGRCLAAYCLQHLEYREFIYVDQVRDALNMYKEEEKQVFFFDDFWGDTQKNKNLPDNEEKRLLKFIQLITESRNKILILVSQEYILQQGLAEYHNKQLKTFFDVGKCMLRLEDYSDLIKAKILFNHLYFLEKLEWDYIEVIANGYERIINHENYHPGIIEDFFNKNLFLIEENGPHEFYCKFLEYLNDPYPFWEDIFNNQTYGARLTTLILFLSSQPMRLADLKESFYSCVEAGRQNYILIEDEVFENIIAQLEETMIVTRSKQRTSNFLARLEKPFIVAEFQNAPIKDFLYRYLAENLHQYGKILIQGCPFINQLLFMFNTSGFEFGGVDKEALPLPESFRELLINRIISEFDTLKYSYVEEDPYDSEPSVFAVPEGCVVRKLYDVVSRLGIYVSVRVDAFLIDKVKCLCRYLHEKDYPFSYDDMVMFPCLIKAVMPLKIDFDATKLINAYYARSGFAEHLLLLRRFEKIFPKEYALFKKINYNTIRHKIKDVLLDNIDFFASDGEDARISYLIEILYPEILTQFELQDSKTFWEDYRMIDGYLANQLSRQEREEMIKRNEREFKIKREEEINTEKTIGLAKVALLGKRDGLSDKEVIDFIYANATNITEAEKLVEIFKKQSVWYLSPFFKYCDRLSLLQNFSKQEKEFPLSSAIFYERLIVYLITEYSNSADKKKNDLLVEMFSSFAFEMLKKGQWVFSKQIIEKHGAFKAKLKTGEIDLSLLLSFPLLVQRGIWFQFHTPILQVYLALKHFLSCGSQKQITSYANFLNFNYCFVDWEHDVWLLCLELDLENFNRYYLIPKLEEYLSAVDAANPYTVCSSTFKFFGVSMNFRLSKDTISPELLGGCYCGVQVSLFSFLNKHLFEIDTCFEGFDAGKVDRNNNHSNKLLLRNYILKEGTEGYKEDEFRLDLVRHGDDPVLLGILESLGICDFLWDFYHEGLTIVEEIRAANYNIRLDRYLKNPETYVFPLEK